LAILVSKTSNYYKKKRNYKKTPVPTTSDAGSP